MKYGREQLKKLGIHDLRNLARETGVKNPTSRKRKEDLIEAVIAIQEGRLEPVAPANRGRPPISKTAEYPKSAAGVSAVLADRGLQTGYTRGSAKFDGFKPVRPHERLDDVLGCLRGQRVLIAAHPGADALKTLNVFLASLKQAGAVRPYTVLIDAPPEGAAEFFENADGEKIVSPLGTPSFEHIKTTAYYLSEVKRLAAEGEDAVLVVYSIDALYRAFYTIDQSQALSAVKIFFGAGRKLEEAGSLTVVGFIKDSPGILLDSLADLANAVVYIKSDGTQDKDKSWNK